VNHLLSGFEFRQPAFLWLLLLVPLVWLWARHTPGAVRFSSVDLVPRVQPSLRLRLLWLPPALLALSTSLLVVGLAGPQRGDRTSKITREGIAIMMVVDTSGSMAALDLSQGKHEETRLDAVKRVFTDFVAGGGGLPGRPDDSIGIVRFARYADTACPLSLDHTHVLAIADSLQLVTDREEDGTAIGDALALATERLRQSKAKSKVAILLTDGVNNAGDESPTGAAALAATQGVKVYTIGAGTNGVAPIRITDPVSGRSMMRAVNVEIDEKTLTAIAQRTGGRYFRATDYDGLRKVLGAIDQLERTTISEERYRQYHHYFGYLVGPALLLLSVAWGLGATVLRRSP